MDELFLSTPGKGAAMPYFIYRVFEFPRVENVAICEHFEDAIAQEKALRDAAGLPHKFEIKMVVADTEAHARELLFHVRSPEEGVIGDT
jgi:hypothetical protein